MASDFSQSWALSRSRFLDSFSDLNHEQINWRLHDETLTIAEMALHVAGVEIYFTTQLLKQTPEGVAATIAKCATEGVVNANPFPFSVDEMTPEFVAEAMELAKSMVEPVITEASAEIRGGELVSALGPVISGDGGFARLGFHAGYHQGQVHLIRTAPGFPKTGSGDYH